MSQLARMFSFKGLAPRVHSSVFLAPNASIIGDVTIGPKSSVWFGCVLRADMEKIVIGSETNIQDLSCLHEDTNKPLIIGDRVTIGHQCIIHGCTLEDDCLIGMGSVLLNGCVIGKGSVVAAGSVVREGQVIPAHSLVAGVPAVLKKTIDPKNISEIQRAASSYYQRGQDYRSSDHFSEYKL